MDDRSQPQPSPSSRRRRRWLQAITALVLVIAAVLALLPFGLAYGLQRWLLAHGADRVEIGDVDFNPFTGTLVLSELTVGDGGDVGLQAARMHLDIDWLPLWQRRVDVQRLELDSAALRIDTAGEAWRIGGLVLAPLSRTAAHEPGVWGLGLRQVALRDLALHVHAPMLVTNLHIDSADLTRFATWNAGQDRGQLRLQGRIQEAPIEVEGGFAAHGPEPGGSLAITVRELPLEPWQGVFGDTPVKLAGRLTAQLRLQIARKDGALHLAPQGEWRIAGLALGAADRRLSAAALAWSGESEWVYTADGVDVHDAGRYRLEDLRFVDPAQDDGPEAGFRVDSLEWEGDVHLQRPAHAAAALQADGALSSAALRAQLPGGRATLTSAGGRWRGTLRYGMQDVPAGYEISGRLTLREPRITGADAGLVLVAGDMLRLDGIDVKGTYRLAAEILALDRWRLLAPADDSGPPVLAGEAARIQPVALDGLRHVRAGVVELDGVSGLLRREADGAWYLIGRGGGLWPAPAADAPPPGGLRIDRLQVSAGSRLRIEDQGVSPPYAAALTLQRLQVEALDRSQPHRPSPFLLEGRLNRHAPLRIQGEVLPFATHPGAFLKGEVQSLDLAPLSPYAAAALGYRIASGQLDGTLDLRIVEQRLRGGADLRLRGLELEPAPDNGAELDRQLGMPLQTALAMLRDRDGEVRLDVPIRGDLDSPEFRLSKVVRRALANTLQQTVLTTLKLSLQPFGAIVMAAELAQEMAGAVRLEAVDFVAGSAHLTPVARQYMERLAALLQARPQLQIRICGLATPADRQAADTEGSADQLLDLAGRRAAAVKDTLTAEHGIAAARLFLCRPRIGDGVPRVELAL